jgi:hypothetical protein
MMVSLIPNGRNTVVMQNDQCLAPCLHRTHPFPGKGSLYDLGAAWYRSQWALPSRNIFSTYVFDFFSSRRSSARSKSFVPRISSSNPRSERAIATLALFTGFPRWATIAFNISGARYGMALALARD